MRRTLALLLVLFAWTGGTATAQQAVGDAVNDACEAFNAKARDLRQPETVNQLRRYVAKQTRLARRLAKRLDGILAAADPPPAALEQLTQVLDKQIALLADIEAAILAEDDAEFERLNRRNNKQDRKGDRLARKLGAPACAEDL